MAVGIFSPVMLLSSFAAEALAIPPRAERVTNRIAERRYARMSIAEARAARAEARVAEIAPVVPVPPPPRPATVRRLARAGVPLSAPPPPTVIAAGPSPVRQPAVPQRSPAAPAMAATPPAPRPLASAATAARPVPPAAMADPGAWTLAPDDAVTPATAEVAPDGTRSVLSADNAAPASGAAATPPAAGRPGPAVTQPAVELLPTPEAK